MMTFVLIELTKYLMTPDNALQFRTKKVTMNGIIKELPISLTKEIHFLISLGILAYMDVINQIPSMLNQSFKKLHFAAYACL
jgi:hypothetical protein